MNYIKILASLLFISSMFVFSSCDDNKNDNEYSEKILGIWQIVKIEETYKETADSKEEVFNESIENGRIMQFKLDNTLVMSVYDGNEEWLQYPGLWQIKKTTLQYNINNGEIASYEVVFSSNSEMKWIRKEMKGYYQYQSVQTLKKIK